MPPDAIGVGGDFADRRAADWFEGSEVDEFAVGIGEAAAGEGWGVRTGESEVEKVIEAVVFPDAEVGEYFFFDDKDFSGGFAGEAAGYTGLDDEIGAMLVELSHE